MAKRPTKSTLEQIAEAAGHVAPQIVSNKADDIPPAEAWAAAEERTGRAVRRALTQRKVTITVPDTRPIGIAAISDQHIQTDGPTDMTRMREDAELVERTAGLYAFLGGDGVDNHLKHRAAMLSAGSRPKRQWDLFGHYLGMFGATSILGVISGNHDNWSQQFADIDMVDVLAKARKMFYAQDELLAQITVGGFTLAYAIRHKFRFNSSLNQTHAIKRWWEMGSDNWDVGVLCHLHELALEPFNKHGKRRYAMRPGSYQVTSGHSRSEGFNATQPSCPTVIIRPREGRFMAFEDVRDAADYLTYLRGRKTA
jgi:hypothetical protein